MSDKSSAQSSAQSSESQNIVLIVNHDNVHHTHFSLIFSMIVQSKSLVLNSFRSVRIMQIHGAPQYRVSSTFPLDFAANVGKRMKCEKEIETQEPVASNEEKKIEVMTSKWKWKRKFTRCPMKNLDLRLWKMSGKLHNSKSKSSLMISA